MTCRVCEAEDALFELMREAFKAGAELDQERTLELHAEFVDALLTYRLRAKEQLWADLESGKDGRMEQRLDELAWRMAEEA